MAQSADKGTKPAAKQSRKNTSSRDSMEVFFFNLFSDSFMRSIGPTRMVLEQKYAGMLSDIIDNLHKLSAHAADMVQRQGLVFGDLNQEEQNIFTGEFLRQIDVFADKVRESFEEITPEQEEKLLKAYAKPRPSDN
jgi:hypothetical protein